MVQRGLAATEIKDRYSAVCSMGMDLELDSPLFQKRFPINVTLAIAESLNMEPEAAESPQVEEPLTEEEIAAKKKAAKEAKEAEERGNSILLAALNSLIDTEAEVAVTLQALQDLQAPLNETGGGRHATAIIANRTANVLIRRTELLHKVEERKAALDVAVKRKEQIFKDVTDNTPCPDALVGVRQFVVLYTHKPEEYPGDADKSNFNDFAAKFGLPRKHKLFENLMETAKDIVMWWVATTMDLCMEGAESEQIKRHMDLIAAVGADKSVYEEISGQISEMTEILGDRLAERCLKVANQLKDKDAGVVQRSADAQPNSARDNALAVNDEIKRAVNLGCPNKHAMLIETKAIAIYLEGEEKIRYGLKALLAAQKLKKRDDDDAMLHEKSNGIPPVGPASAFADKVDKEIQDAKKLGASPTHQHMIDAKAISSALRDLDGTRKRLENRAKRQSQDAS